MAHLAKKPRHHHAKLPRHWLVTTTIITVSTTMPPPFQPPKPTPTTLDETHANNHQEKPTLIWTHATHNKPKQNPWQTHIPTSISIPHPNTDLCTKPQMLISTPPHWLATRERRELMSGWWLAMAGDSRSGHGVVAMEFWVWREGLSKDWKERENQRLRDEERDVRQRVKERESGRYL